MTTKNWLLGACMVAVLMVQAPQIAEAKRLGGGNSSGMQRSMPASPAPAGTPAKPTQSQQAAPAAAPVAAAQPAGKRSWMGPIAGLAAGLGIAALMSHLGMGEAFGNFLMMALLAVVAVVAIGWLMRRFGNKGRASTNQPAFAGAGTGAANTHPADVSWPAQNTTTQRNAMPSSAANSFESLANSFGMGKTQGNANMQSSVPAAPVLPADFDVAGFERIAKMIFIRLQAANDAGDLTDLRNFTTPELFANIRLDLQERGTKTQQTDVVDVQCQVLDLVRETDRDVVSVRYHGMIREQVGAPAEAFDEIWHLVQPRDGSRTWAIAGIQQSH